MRNKIIMKFSKRKNYEYFRPIKRLYGLSNNKNNNISQIKDINSLSYKNKKLNKIQIQNISKLKENKNRSFLDNLYKTINESSLINNRKKNVSENNSIKKEKEIIKPLTKIVKFSRKGIVGENFKKEDLINNELDDSFSFGPQNKIKTVYDLYKLNNRNLKKKDNLERNKSITNKNEKEIIDDYLKINTFYNSQNHKSSIKKDLKPINSTYKILKYRNNYNSFLNKKNIVTSPKINSSLSTMFTQSKKNFFSKSNNSRDDNNNMENTKNINHIKNLKNNTSLKIFQIAVKYKYLSKENNK